MKSDILLFGFIFFAFYMASFFSVTEADITYWVIALSLSLFGLPIKGYILKQSFTDWTTWAEEVPVGNKRHRVQAFIVNILFALAMLFWVISWYFIE